MSLDMALEHIGKIDTTWTTASGRQRFDWFNSKTADLIAQRDKEWKAVSRYDTKGRGKPAEFWRDNLHDEKKIREVLEDKAKLLQEKIATCNNSETLLEMLQDSIGLKNVDIDGLYGYSYNDEGGFSTLNVYITNEFVLPILYKLEKIIPNKTNEVKDEVVRTMLALARFSLKPHEMVHPITGEILTSIALVDPDNAEKNLSSFMEWSAHNIRFFKKRGDAATESEYVDKYHLVYMQTDMSNLHEVLCSSLLSADNYDGVRVANVLSKTLKFLPHGSLPDYIEAFHKIGAERSFVPLLENLKSEDLQTRRMSAEILYSLELKSLKVSPDGIQYFNKIYKLVDENNPYFWANYYSELLSSSKNGSNNGEIEAGDRIRILDEEGKVGIFGEKGLLGFFKLKLEGESEHINANISYIATRDFFLEKADEKPENKLLRETMLHTLIEDYANVRDEVEEKSGLKLHALKLHEQGWFIAFWTDKKTTQKEKERVIKIAQKYGTIGIKTFLTLDYGESASELLGFLESESLSESEKNSILRNYSMLIDRSFEWRKLFDESEKGLDLNFSAEIHEAMIRKSSEYLQAAINISQDKESEVTISELIKSLEEVSFTLEKLKGLYVENSNLRLTQTQYHEGYREIGNENSKNPKASETWNFVDITDGSTVSVTVRLEQVYDGNGEKFERRVNFKVKNKEKKMEGRIGIDMDTYPMKAGQSDREMLSLDLATGKTDFKNRIHGTVSVTRILNSIKGGEGGHTYASFSKKSAERYGEIATTFREYMINRFGWKLTWKEKGEQARGVKS